jgi:hypothetical protein
MHPLRVEAAGKVDDLGLVDPDLSEFADGAGDVVFEIAVF